MSAILPPATYDTQSEVTSSQELVKATNKNSLKFYCPEPFFLKHSSKTTAFPVFKANFFSKEVKKFLKNQTSSIPSLKFLCLQEAASNFVIDHLAQTADLKSETNQEAIFYETDEDISLFAAESNCPMLIRKFSTIVNTSILNLVVPSQPDHRAPLEAALDLGHTYFIKESIKSIKEKSDESEIRALKTFMLETGFYHLFIEPEEKNLFEICKYIIDELKLTGDDLKKKFKGYIYEKESLLDLAAGSGDLNLVKFLADFPGITPEDLYEVPQLYMASPLYYALEKGQFDVVEYLINCTQITPEIFMNSLPGSLSPLHLVAKSGNLKLFKYVEKLVGPTYVNAESLREVDYLSQTPFHLAAEGGHVELFEYLANFPEVTIDDLFKENKNGLTPFLCAIKKGNKKICDFFINNPNITIKKLKKVTSQGYSPFHIAARENLTDIFIFLADALKPSAGELIHTSFDKEGYTTMHWAAKKDNLVICRFLVDFPGMTKDRISLFCNLESTPLHLYTPLYFAKGDLYDFLSKYIDYEVRIKDPND